MRPTSLTAIAIAVLSLALPAEAQSQLPADPNRPTDKIAADLDIPEQVFIACFRNVTPDPDHAPDNATQHGNKAVLLPCLQAANPDISNHRLDAVMDRYRPEGPINRG